jgi:hypothetical protein
MRLLVPAIAVLAACGSGGHGGGAAAGGAGGRPLGMLGPSPDAQDAQNTIGVADASAAGDAVDAAPTFSCLLAAEAGGPAACIELDPGFPDPATLCDSSGAGPVVTGPCPRDGSAGGCHQATPVDAGLDTTSPTAGYTTWWYAPLGLGAVLTRCEQMSDSYVSP